MLKITEKKKGINLHYSGTVGAAREALINGIPSIAASLSYPTNSSIWHFASSAAIVVRIMEVMLEKGEVEKYKSVININVPNIPPSEIKGVKVVKQGSSKFEEYYVEAKKGESDENTKTFRLEGKMKVYDPSEEYDTAGLLSFQLLKSIFFNSTK